MFVASVGLMVLAASAPSLSTVTFGHHFSMEIAQEFSGAEEGSVIWDAARSLLAHLTLHSGTDADPLQNQRVLEIGSGTGVIGLAIAHLGERCMGARVRSWKLPDLIRSTWTVQEPRQW